MEQIRLKNDELVMFGSYNQGDCIDQLTADAHDFVPIVREQMGNDSANFVSELIDLCEHGTESDEEWEMIADEHRQMLEDTLTELDAVLQMCENNPGMSKKKIIEAIKPIRDNIYNNL